MSDYTEELQSIAESMLQIADGVKLMNETLNDILNKPLALMAEHNGNIAEIQAEVKKRMETNSLGIFMRQTENDSTELTRAITVNALRKSEQMSDVAEEVLNPTSIP